MIPLVEQEEMTVYIGADQALFVLANQRHCPRCGRPTLLFQHKNGHTECLGCTGSDSTPQAKIVTTSAPQPH